MASTVDNCVPRLTTLRSVRNASGPHETQSISSCGFNSVSELSTCTTQSNVKTKLTKTLRINNVVPWKTFQILLEKNTTHVDTKHVNEDILLESVAQILKSNGIKAFHQSGNISQIIGKADSIIYQKNGSRLATNCLVIGHNYNNSDLTMASDLSALLEKMNFEFNGKPMLTSTISEKDGLIYSECLAIERLLHALVMNGLYWGYIQNNNDIRLVKIVSYHNCLEVILTKTYPINQSVLPLVSICIESFHGSSKLKESPEITCFPISVCSPNIMPLSSYEKESTGSVKWWEVRKNSFCTYSIALDNFTLNLTAAGRCWKAGYISEQRKPLRGDLNDENCSQIKATFLIASGTDNKLEHTASVISYLNESKLSCVPKLITYAHVQDYHLLAFDAEFRPIERLDIERYNLSSRIHDMLSELHQNGIMLGSFTLDSICIDTTDNYPHRILISEFYHARLVRSVPHIVREREHDMLDSILNLPDN